MRGSLVAMFLLIGTMSLPAYSNNMFYPTQSQQRLKALAHQGAWFKDAGRLVYYGGPIISNVKVYAVFWGAAVDSDLQKNIGGFYKAASNSTQVDFLAQYNTVGVPTSDGRTASNQTINRGNYGGEYLITPQETKTDLADSDIHAELEAQFAAHVLPAPDENSLYMIYFPAGISITIEGQSSCSTFCAYHNGFASSKFGSVFYGVMPDYTRGACSFSCGFGNNAFDMATIISSHEFFEEVTDPFPTPGNNPAYPQAWNTTDGQEIGDLCASTSGELSTAGQSYRVQGEWDNFSNSCATGPYQSN